MLNNTKLSKIKSKKKSRERNVYFNSKFDYSENDTRIIYNKYLDDVNKSLDNSLV